MTDFISSFMEIMMPFLAAFIFAYILEPLTKRLLKAGIPHAIAALISLLIGVLASLIIFMLLLNLINHEVPLIKTQFPIWLKATQEWLEPVLASFNIALDWNMIREHAQSAITSQLSDNANTLVTKSLGTVLKSSGSVLGFFANTVMVLFVLFYLLLEWDALNKLHLP